MKLIQSFFIILSAIIFYHCKNEQTAATKIPNYLPDSLIDKKGVFLYPTVIDMGKLERGVPVRSKTILVNHSDQEINLMDPSTTCGCTAVLKNKNKVAQGDTAQFWITYDAKIPGIFSKNAYINYEAQPTVLEVEIKGHVKF